MRTSDIIVITLVIFGACILGLMFIYAHQKKRQETLTFQSTPLEGTTCLIIIQSENWTRVSFSEVKNGKWESITSTTK